MKSSYLLFSILGIVACGGSGGDDSDTTAPVITILGNQTLTMEVGSAYADAGATATDDVSGDLSSELIISSTVRSTLLGSYTVTYSVTDDAGNEASEIRTVNVIDTVSPVIEILGDNPATVELGSHYIDAGARVTDAGDGTVNVSLVTTGTVDTSQLGIYTIAYSAGDNSGNLARKTRSVEVYNALPTSLNQARYNATNGNYEYLQTDFHNILISDAPVDTDRSRWAMLHDNAGDAYRLYFFQKGANDTLYQFVYDLNSGVYQYQQGANGSLKLTGMPDDADPDSFAMLHDGFDYRLSMQSKTTKRIYQAVYNAESSDYEYGGQLDLVDGPEDTDYSRWAMLHDGNDYRFYAFKTGSDTYLYQFLYNPSLGGYVYGSNLDVQVMDMPASSDESNFSMLHDGIGYAFYFLNDDE